MSELQLPNPKPKPEEPEGDIEGTICPFRSGSFDMPVPGIAGGVNMQVGAIKIPCTTQCPLYLRSNNKAKPGTCALAEIGRAARSVRLRPAEKASDSKVTL